MIAAVIVTDDLDMADKHAPSMWLYPIKAETRFYLDAGLKKLSGRAGAAGFAEVIERGARDVSWDIGTNQRNIQVGDEILVYASKTQKTPPLLIGVGIVQREPRRSSGRKTKFSIDIRWDVAICKRLSEDPIDATWIADTVPVQKAGGSTIPAALWPKIRDKIAFKRVDDLDGIISASLSVTETKALIAQRLGQGKFKLNVCQIERRCRLTGVTDLDHLQASHIKPWKDASNTERLDGNNGLLLSPHVHHLFDRGLLSFDAQGRVLFSPKLDKAVRYAWGLAPLKTGAFNKAQQRYLEHHRTTHGFV